MFFPGESVQHYTGDEIYTVVESRQHYTQVVTDNEVDISFRTDDLTLVAKVTQ